jgi:hypothetical protein
VYLAGRLGDFGNHEYEMPPHLPGDLGTFFRCYIGERDSQIFINDMPSHAKNTTH